MPCSRSTYARANSGDRGYIKLGDKSIIYFCRWEHMESIDPVIRSVDNEAPQHSSQDSDIQAEPVIDETTAVEISPAEIMPDQRPNVHVFWALNAIKAEVNRLNKDLEPANRIKLTKNAAGHWTGHISKD